MLILGIETSCDETAIALCQSRQSKISVISQTLASQINLHQKYGGVVPEIAAREHVSAIIPLLKEVWQKCTVKPAELDAIAVTTGPGLESSLLVGVDTAKALAFAWKKPLISVNHVSAHLAANWIVKNENDAVPIFPAVALVVSGGHTELILLNSFSEHQYLGGTRDDAAGEAFDKVAKLLGLPMPGGPELEKLARDGNELAFSFPSPLQNSGGYDFSFSGLKTAVLYLLKKRDSALSKKEKSDLAASFQKAAVSVLVKKTLHAVEEFKPRSLILAGGVAANNYLRSSLSSRLAPFGVPLFMPDKQYCTDNAAMVAAAGAFLLNRHLASTWQEVNVNANWELN